jgi:MFS transporter, PPP family, 3-phenylpropionic acid transporter
LNSAPWPGAATRLAAFYFAYFAYVGAFSPYFALYLQGLGKSAIEISVLLGITAATRMLGPALWGWLAQRYGQPRRLMRVTACAAACVFMGLFWGQSFWWIFAVLCLLQGLTSALMPLNEAMTLRYLGDNKSRYGPIRLWGSVGFIVSVLGLGYLLDGWPVQVVLWATGGLIVAVAGMAWWLPPDTARQAPARDAGEWADAALPEPLPARGMPTSPAMPTSASAPRSAPPLESLSPQAKRLGWVAFLTACVAMNFAHGALYNFYTIHMTGLGYSKASVGWLWTIGVVAEIAVFAWLPRLQARFSLDTLFALSLAACALRFVLIGWAGHVLVLAVLAQLLHAATFAVHHAVSVQLVERWVGRSRMAQGLATFTALSYGFGGLTGGLAAGALWDQVGPAWTFTVASLAGLFGLIVALRFARSTP